MRPLILLDDIAMTNGRVLEPLVIAQQCPKS